MSGQLSPSILEDDSLVSVTEEPPPNLPDAVTSTQTHLSPASQGTTTLTVSDTFTEHDQNSLSSDRIRYSSVTSIAPWHRTEPAATLTDDTERPPNEPTDDSRPSSSLRIDENTRDSIRSEDSNSRDCEEPPAKVRKINSPNAEIDETDGETCPICLDSWGNSGDHKLVALKCGHLFGELCVQRWLRAQPTKDRSCPTCKTRANMKDLRFIYARKLVAADNSQVAALQRQVETLQAEKSRTELELQKTKISLRSCSMQLDVVRSLMKCQADKEQPAPQTWRFALEKNLEICKEGGCRVLTYNSRTCELYVSQCSSNALFPGYGIRKVSCVDYRPGQYVPLHGKPIRDLTYSQPRDQLLSVALDGAARVLERGAAGLTLRAGVPLWSCSWDRLRSHDLYVGGVGGLIRQYDVRSPAQCVRTLRAPGDASPVVSLRSTEFGLLSCQLNSCWLWTGEEPRALPAPGGFMSLCYEEESGRAAVWSRPGAGGAERSTLTVCRLRSAASGEVVVSAERTFSGSARAAVMSRACWLRAPHAAWLAAHSESDAELRLHGVEGARGLALPAAQPALDLAPLQLPAGPALAALSHNRLRIYKAVPVNT